MDYRHGAMPYPMVGLLWSPNKTTARPEMLHGIFLPQKDGAPVFDALAALFSEPAPTHAPGPAHYLVLDDQGNIIATNAADILRKAAANDQATPLDVGRHDGRITYLRTSNGEVFATDHRHDAAWEISHTSHDTPLVDARPLCAHAPSLATVIRIHLVNVRALVNQTHDLVQLLDLHKTMLWRVGHNIRTPLNAIYGYWQLYQLEHPEFGDKNAKRHAIFRDSIRQINQTIEDATSIPSLCPEAPSTGAQTDVADALHIALSMSHQAIEARDIRFHAQGPATLVQASTQVLVEVLLNLISNAVKFSPTGAEVSISWRCEQPVDKLTLVFENQVDGPHHAGSEHTRHAERHLHARRAVPGSGVGLATCGFLLRRMGGELLPTTITAGRARSQITLPLASAAK